MKVLERTQEVQHGERWSSHHQVFVENGGAFYYEFFPQAERKRPKRPGGWVVGPELGWRGFTPAAKGRPMSNTLLLGIWFGYYWGK